MIISGDVLEALGDDLENLGNKNCHLLLGNDMCNRSLNSRRRF
jgi:hypothetical protein